VIFLRILVIFEEKSVAAMVRNICRISLLTSLAGAWREVGGQLQLKKEGECSRLPSHTVVFTFSHSILKYIVGYIHLTS